MEESANTAAEEQELIDVLIAISVVARRLARKLENQKKETNNEQNE
ncbi:MAG: hypothetical protein IKP40_10060 [Clostridia bacterium]|nr:hypothetical protein [Clostridia bacterium]